MITSLQFDDAIKIINEYKSQVENGVVKIKEKVILVDIQDKISKNTFHKLQSIIEDCFHSKPVNTFSYYSCHKAGYNIFDLALTTK